MKKIELKIIALLCQGYSQSDIAYTLKSENIRPNSVSSVEKYINALKNKFNCKSLFQLGALLQKAQLINISINENTETE